MTGNQMASAPVNIESLMGASASSVGIGILFPSTFVNGVIPPLYLSRQEKPFGGIDPELVARASLYAAILKKQKDEKQFRESQQPIYLTDKPY